MPHLRAHFQVEMAWKQDKVQKRVLSTVWITDHAVLYCLHQNGCGPYALLSITLTMTR